MTGLTVHIPHGHGIIRDVAHVARAASALEVGGLGGGRVGPDLDARAVLGVGHAYVVDHYVLDYVDFGAVLACVGGEREGKGLVWGCWRGLDLRWGQEMGLRGGMGGFCRGTAQLT